MAIPRTVTRQVRRMAAVFLVATSMSACIFTPGITPRGPATASVIYVAAGGQSVRADYYTNETVVLTLSDGSTRVLRRAVSASGARYTAGRYEWWEHQGEATLRMDDKEVFVGKLTP